MACIIFMELGELEEILNKNNQQKFRLNQIRKAVFEDGVSSFLEISNLPKDLRELLNNEIRMLSFDVEKMLISKDERSAKALFKLSDGNFIESVLISPKGGDWSVCISTQVGCPIGCAFCATGKMGFKRNLTSEEITDQVLFWLQFLKAKSQKLKAISNIVYMGMGEPFLNWENVKESLKILTDKNIFNFGSRSISVSTAGIPEGIEKLAQEFPQINLAISLHFADDEKRKKYMPISNKYDLVEIKKAIENYFTKTNRKIFIEYVMLDGINDSEEDLEKLVSYLKSFEKSYLLHINLISYNSNSDEFNSSSGNKIQNFKNLLLQNKINCTIRKSLGQDIQGACGQLAGK